MKIGIITFHWNFNYGANLQAFALSETLKKMGHIPVFINYRPAVLEHNQTLPWGIRSGKFYYNIYRRFHFRCFQSLRLSSTRRLHDSAECKKASESCDALIAGSDVIWDMDFYGEFASPYLLDFGDPNRQILIAFSPSMSKRQSLKQINQNPYYQNFSKLIKRFHHISVRDNFSRLSLIDQFGIDPRITCDPTLLISSFPAPRMLINLPKRYVLFYWFKTELPVLPALICQARAKFNLPIVFIYCGQNIIDFRHPKTIPEHDILVSRASPLQWIDLFRRAHFVITDSFHGTIFSLKSMRPFLAQCHVGNGMGKVSDLLFRYGLENRLLPHNDVSPDARLFRYDTADLEHAIARANSHARESREFLERALQS